MINYKPKYESTVLIVDGAHALRRSMYQPSYRELSTAQGMPTGAVFGVCKILCSLKHNFPANSIVVTLEGGHSKRRMGLYEDYKHRSGDTDEIQEDTGMTDFQYYVHQQSWLKKLLACLNIRVITTPGKEGDDVIYQLSHLIKGKKVIISEDKDFYSLISENISLYRPIRGETVSIDTFSDVTGYDYPVQFLYEKVLLGDGSDNIPSVCKGVGGKTVSDVLKKIPVDEISLKSIKSTAAEFKGARYQKLAMMDDTVFNRNMALIDISQEAFSILELTDIIKELQTDTWDLNSALKIMSALEFGESTKQDLLNLGEQCRMYPFTEDVINKGYLLDVMSGISTTLLG